MSGMKLFLLGAPRLEREGAPVHLGRRKALALLVYLAVTGEPHRREALAALLWSDYDESRAYAYLRRELWALRQSLGDDWLTVERDVIGPVQPARLWLDVAQFRRLLAESNAHDHPDNDLCADCLSALATAVELYRGDFLAGFTLPDSPTFDEWHFFQAESLRQALGSALDRLVRAHRARGAFEAAIPYARRRLALDSLHEATHQTLMQLYAWSGQQAAALRQYQECVRILDEELGAPPSKATSDLYEAIKEQRLPAPGRSTDPGPAVEETERQESPAHPPPQPPAFLTAAEPVEVSSPIFFGREQELAQLDGFLEKALAGQGGVVFVIGEAGQGKTSLVNEFARRAQMAHPDLMVAGGSCHLHMGVGDPFLPFREMLNMLTGDVEHLWAAGIISRDHARRLWDLLPQAVRTLVDHGPHLIDTFISGRSLAGRVAAHTPAGTDWQEPLPALLAGQTPLSRPALDQEHIFEEVTGVLKALAARNPLLLTLDDLHWADASSISLLFHLGRQITERPILLVGSYRPEDIALGRDGKPHPLDEVLNEFKRYFGDVWVDLDRAGPTEGRKFIDALLDAVPNRLTETFRQELARHTGGQPLFTVELLRDMQERGDLQQDDRGQWIESSNLTWDSLPARVEGVIEKRIGRLDAELREVLTVASVEGEEFTAEVIARVLEIDEPKLVRRLSGELEKQHRLVVSQGLRRLDQGGQRLSSYRFRHNLFRTYLYHSLDEVERYTWHEAVGNVLEQLHARQIEPVAVQLARHFEQAGLASKAIGYWHQAGDAAAHIFASPEAIVSYGRALALITHPEASSEELRQLYTGLGRALELNDQYDQALSNYKELRTLAQQRNDRSLELTALMAQITLHAVPGPLHDPNQGQTLGEQALILARDLGDQVAEARLLWNLSTVSLYSNRMPQAIDYGERSLALARKLNLREQMAFTLNDIAGCYWVLGRFDRAKETIRDAQALWQELGNLPMLADSLHVATQINIRIGEYDQAIVSSEEAFQISQSINNVWGKSASGFRLGFVYWERGQIEQAITIMEETIRQSEAGGFIVPQAVTRTELAAVYGSLGHTEHAIELVRLALTIASEQMPLYQAFVLGMLAQLQLLNDNIDEANHAIDLGKKDPGREAWPVYFVSVRFADSRLALKLADYERALAVADELLGDLRQYGMRSEIPGTLYLLGQALLGLGRDEAARNRLQQAYAEAETIGSRRMMWQISFALSRLEPDPVEAERLRQQAREIIEFIAGHIRAPDLRASFLGLPKVQTVLAPGASP